MIPLLPAQFADAEVHNIRAAFVAGLAVAMNKITLVLQPQGGPAPLDVRDLVKTFNQTDDIASAIATFALDVTERLQADDPLPLPKGNFLAELSIGDPVAENEFQTLYSYYIRTDQYMRPRNLIKLLAHCRGFAVGLERARIEEVDFEKGLRAYSLDLITEADQELTDILGSDTNLIYHFIGEGEEFKQTKLEGILAGGGVSPDKIENVLEFMLYYGFLGVKMDAETVRYIFDVGYDMRLLKVLVAKAKQNLTYVLNPAFYPGLNL